MVILSFFNSRKSFLHLDRWLDPNSPLKLNRNYIVSGSRLQRCIGVEYAFMNIMLVLSTASVLMGTEPEVTPLSNEAGDFALNSYPLPWELGLSILCSSTTVRGSVRTNIDHSRVVPSNYKGYSPHDNMAPAL
jgi:hypothetical protein